MLDLLALRYEVLFNDRGTTLARSLYRIAAYSVAGPPGTI